MKRSFASLLAVILGLAGGCGDGPDPGARSGNADDRRSESAGAIESVPLGPRKAGAPNARMFALLPPAETGIDFENRFDWEHPLEHLYPHGYAGGGVCVGDYDDDGRPDVYLVSQTGRDRLYRQVDAFRFEDVTDSAGVDHAQAWGTGAVFADADGDRKLDLYVCNYDAPNRLYLNNGDGTFREAAAEAGLDFRGASIMAGFADYDGDGDLDVHLLTNRLYPGPGLDEPRTRQVDGKVAVEEGYEELFAIQERVIGGERQKFVVKAGQPDRLYRNDGNGRFTEVGAEAGISGNHPGLSATWWDHDHDGRPDLYVCNDFWDPDRLYRNNGDGTFTDVLADTMPHTPWFSMGSDFGDLNNDGLLDFVAADMSATTHFMSKLMMGDMNESRWFLESAEPRQYMRNAVYLNTGTGRFMEVAFLAGLASTDWTWSVKLGDLDCDGRLDAFFTNGTANHSFDPDLTRELRELEADQNARRLSDAKARWEEQWAVYRREPPRRERNAAFRNLGDLEFAGAAAEWGLDHEGISFGAALADLDRDGDLDLVVNNVDDPASVYRNDADQGHRLLVRLRGAGANTHGHGASVTAETAAGRQVRLVAPTSGYMSANEPLVHFGLGDHAIVDRLTVKWPGGHVQGFADLAADRFYTITEPAAPAQHSTSEVERRPQFQEASDRLGLRVRRDAERPYDDFARQPLLPAKLSQLGPGLAWGDADGDGDEDLFVGAPAGQTGTLIINEGAGSFTRGPAGPWVVDRRCEDMAPLWLDANGDGHTDLFVASGGVECEPGADVLIDRLYLGDGRGGFTKAPPGALPAEAESSGAAVAGDYDRDGDLDLFVGGRVIPGAYPLAPRSRLLRNDRGTFVDVTSDAAPGLARVGLVTAALFSDADGDGLLDLLVALEWGPVALWRNTGDGFIDATASSGLAAHTGWWNGLTGADLDGDGDIDYVATNAGLNTKYHASPGDPALLYYGDFEGSGRKSLVEAKRDHDVLLPVRGRSCSSDAMPFVGEKLPTFRAFASASLDEIYTQRRLDEATVYEANTLESGVFVNETGSGGAVRFVFRPLPRLAQASPGYGVVAGDLDGDARADVYVVQNFFQREPETGRWDGGVSLLLRGDWGGALRAVPPAESGLVVTGDATGLTVCDVNGDGRPDLVAARNDEALLAFLNEPGADGRGGFLAVRLRGPPGNPTGVGARVTVVHGNGRTQDGEVYAGSGYLSQSSSRLFFGRAVLEDEGNPPGVAAEEDRDAPVEVRVRWPDGATTSAPVPQEAGSVEIDHPSVARLSPGDPDLRRTVDSRRDLGQTGTPNSTHPRERR